MFELNLIIELALWALTLWGYFILYVLAAESYVDMETHIRRVGRPLFIVAIKRPVDTNWLWLSSRVRDTFVLTLDRDSALRMTSTLDLHVIDTLTRNYGLEYKVEPLL